MTLQGIDQQKITQTLEEFYYDIASGNPGRTRTNTSFVDSLYKSQQADVIANKYHINTNIVLPKLSSEFADAYAVRHINGDQTSFYALVFKPDYQVRLQEIMILKNSLLTNHLAPLEYGIVQLSNSTPKLATIMPKPKGQTLRQFLYEHKVDQHFILHKLLISLLDTLHKMHRLGVVHGRVNPDNIYITPQQNIILGECVSDLYSFSQLPAYETPGQLQCHRYGLGNGDNSNDFYALGILLFYAISMQDFLDTDKAAILASKLADGTVGFLNKYYHLSGELSDVIIGLVTDDKDKRWQYEAVWNFLQHGQYNLPTAPANFDRGLTFCDHEVFSLPALADLLASKWNEAREFIKKDTLIRWVAYVAKNQDLIDALAELRDQVRVKTSVQKLFSREDEWLIKTIILLDPYGPLRLKDITFYKDGIGTMFLHGLRLGLVDITQSIANCIFVDLCSFYEHAANKLKDPGLVTNIAQLKNAHTNFRKSGFSFGIERAIYDLNPLLPCQSPLIDNQWCLSVYDVITYIEGAGKKQAELIANKNLITFIASRIECEQEYKFKEGRKYNDITQSKQAQALTLFATAQKKLNIPSLPKLTHTFKEQIQALLEEVMHNKTFKTQLFAYMDLAAESGQLFALVEAITTEGYLDKDFEGYAKALKRTDAILNEMKQMQKTEIIEREARAAGKKFAVNLGYFISGFAIISALLQVM